MLREHEMEARYTLWGLGPGYQDATSIFSTAVLELASEFKPGASVWGKSTLDSLTDKEER